MKKALLSVLALCLLLSFAQAQNNVGINTTTPHASAALDVTSTTQGVLVPRMTQTQRDAIATPATGLMIFQTDNTPGFYYYSGSAWTAVGSSNGTSLQLFATSTNAQTRPIYAYGRYTFLFNNIVSGANTSSWTNSNTYTVPTGMGGLYNINSLLLLTAYSLTNVPVIAPEIEITRGGTTIVYYGVGTSNVLFQGSTTDNTATPGSGAAGAPYSFSRGMVNLMLPLQAGDVLKIYYRFSAQSTSNTQTISFSTDGTSFLSIVKMN